MGILFIDKNADYSANSLGHAGLYTSVTSGLLALFETRRSASKAVHNSAPGGADGSIIGSPAFAAGSATVAFGSGFDFKTVAAGSHTIAIVAGIRTGGGTNDMPAGTYSAAAFTSGYAYFSLYNRRFALYASTQPTGTVPPLASGNSVEKLAFQDYTVDQPELFFGVMESNVSLRLYNPRTGALATTTAVGRDFVFDAPPSYRTVPFNGGASTFSDSLFAHWGRVLTPAEMNTIYAELQPQLARAGVTI